ncbi:hypothetical protein TNCV_4769201 [Trichonephila clavipes]|nr:hypothetical protein TNCV_4769201 [Trichonephila clavipes]
MGHPPYSPDLASCDFSCLKETHFTSLQVKANGLPKTSFQNCCQEWQHRMQKCVNAEGNYFEDDNVSEN